MSNSQTKTVRITFEYINGQLVPVPTTVDDVDEGEGEISHEVIQVRELKSSHEKRLNEFDDTV